MKNNMEKSSLEILKKVIWQISINIKTSKEFRNFVYEKEDAAVRNRLGIYMYSIDIMFNFYPLSIEDLLYFYVADPKYRSDCIESKINAWMVDIRKVYNDIERDFIIDLKNGCFDYIIKTENIILYEPYTESKNKSWSKFLYNNFDRFKKFDFLSEEERSYISNMEDKYYKYKLYGSHTISIRDIFDLPSYMETEDTTKLKKYRLIYQEPEHIPKSYEVEKVYKELDIEKPTKSLFYQLEYPDRDRIIITKKMDGYIVSLFKLENKLYPLKKDGSPIHHIKSDIHGSMEDEIYSKFIDYIMFHETKFLNLLENEECASFIWLIKKHIVPYRNLNEPIVGIDIVSFKHGERKPLPFDDIEWRFDKLNISMHTIYDTKSKIFIDQADMQLSMFAENTRTLFDKNLNEVNDCIIHINNFGFTYRYERDGEFFRSAQFVGKYLTYFPKYNDNEFSRRNWWNSAFAPSINGYIKNPVDELSL